MVLSGDIPPAGSGEVWVVEGGWIIIATTFKYLWRTLAKHGQLPDPGDDDGRRRAIGDYLAGCDRRPKRLITSVTHKPA